MYRRSKIKIEESLLESCKINGTEFTSTEKLYAPPVKLSDNLINKVIKYSDKIELKRELMLSGAGHDAMVMAKITDVGLIFVPSKGGRSHCPEEWTDYEDLQKGIEVALETIIDISKND